MKSIKIGQGMYGVATGKTDIQTRYKDEGRNIKIEMGLWRMWLFAKDTQWVVAPDIIIII